VGAGRIEAHPSLAEYVRRFLTTGVTFHTLMSRNESYSRFQGETSVVVRLKIFGTDFDPPKLMLCHDKFMSRHRYIGPRLEKKQLTRRFRAFPPWFSFATPLERKFVSNNVTIGIICGMPFSCKARLTIFPGNVG
jgi:hypothetical protein